MAVEYGEPLWCKGTGMRNTHLLAIAPTVSNSRVLDSTRLEDRVITHELNAEEVSNLIKAHLCEDLDIINANILEGYTFIRSHKEKFFGMVKVFPVGEIVITEMENDMVATAASGVPGDDYSSLFIAVTTEGVFQFNLSLLRLDFQAYTIRIKQSHSTQQT